MQKELRLNRLPAITWYWLKMNDTTLTDPGTGDRCEPELTIPAGIGLQDAEGDPFAAQLTGAGEETADWIEGTAPRVQHLTAEKEGIVDPVVVRFTYEGETRQGDVYALDVPRNTQMTVVMDLCSTPEAQGIAGVLTRFAVAENASLELVQIVRTGSGLTVVNDIGGTCAEDAKVSIRHLFLTEGKTYQGCRVDLAGTRSFLQNDIAYLVKGDGHLDMNYLASHSGKNTECAIDVNGVLRDRASKIFRGTIDLLRGAAGAVGNEMENVLMMDDTVQNKTIPLILCAEEDVVGNHGATIGRLDEELLFYLESRGMAKEDIYEMMARARVDHLVDLIPDEGIRNAIVL